MEKSIFPRSKNMYTLSEPINWAKVLRAPATKIGTDYRTQVKLNLFDAKGNPTRKFVYRDRMGEYLRTAFGGKEGKVYLSDLKVRKEMEG